MKFLVTNDDGIDAAGIHILAQVASEFGEVTVVAPERPYSGCGHQVTSDSVISIREAGPGRWAIGGTPADCVRLGLNRLVPEADWILSGINAGANLGVDIFMSGTLAAVREGSLLGRRGIAFSRYCRTADQFDWPQAGPLATRLLDTLLERDLPQGEFWNVNFPAPHESGGNPEVIDCPVAADPLHIDFRDQSSGVQYSGNYHHRACSPGSDVDVCFSGNVSVTQMSVWQIPVAP